MNKEKSTKTILKKVIYFLIVVLTSNYFISTSQASEVKPHQNHVFEKHSELHLSHDLKVILNQEMNGIEKGMIKIIPAIASGNWETIANIAKKIKASFILKQKLNQKQLEELHHSLPAGFIEIDHSFHAAAGKLADAAHQHDAELVNFYFYKLHSHCMKCHSKYASERFSNFKESPLNKSDHH